MEIMQYLTDSGHRSKNPIWWNFEFPNNRGAGVRPSQTMFRFDVEFDDSDGLSLDIARGLTTEEVEAKLAEIATGASDLRT